MAQCSAITPEIVRGDDEGGPQIWLRSQFDYRFNKLELPAEQSGMSTQRSGFWSGSDHNELQRRLDVLYQLAVQRVAFCANNVCPEAVLAFEYRDDSGGLAHGQFPVQLSHDIRR